MALNINQATTTDYGGNEAPSIDSANVETSDSKEYFYTNPRWVTDYGYFKYVAKLRSAIIMKATWTVGKGYETDPKTKVYLEHIVGNGKQTFKDILFNLVVTKQIGRDAFAEIIRDDKTGKLINLKVLDPSTVKIVSDDKGMIKRYEVLKKGSKNEYVKFKTNEIFHLSHNNFSGEIHGTSVCESVEQIILRDNELTSLIQKVSTNQAVPFIIFKLKTEDSAKIATFANKIKDARKLAEDMMIPDDENLVSFEVVQVNPSDFLLAWKRENDNEFYRAVGMPLILFGSAGTTESGGKIEYLGHETVFEHDQLEIEKQIEAQLGIKINLVSPTSLLENLQRDESKDAQGQIAFAQGTVNPAVTNG